MCWTVLGPRGAGAPGSEEVRCIGWSGHCSHRPAATEGALLFMPREGDASGRNGERSSVIVWREAEGPGLGQNPQGLPQGGHRR